MASPAGRRGVDNCNSKLTLDKVRYILSSPKSNRALGLELGVSSAAISNVRTGRTWSWIDADWDEDDEEAYEAA